MHDAKNSRVADIPEKEREKAGVANLPPETHLVTGILEADGAHALASVKASLSARTVSLNRTDSGGISYQLAILVSEPKEAPKPEAPKDPAMEEAVQYMMDKGNMEEEPARKAVERFGLARILEQRKKDLDVEFDAIVGKKE